MPTPFYHLKVAEAVLNHPDLSPAARAAIQAFPQAYFFGHTAPDVQTVSGQPREHTHFFKLPLNKNPLPAWEYIFTSHPDLLAVQEHDPEQGLFLAGYLCHLQADWLWVEQIFEPVFGPHASWQSFPKRLYLHNVLRAHLDYQLIGRLNGILRTSLSQVHPGKWLPFVRRQDLIAWRDLLTPQLVPGAPIQTVEVFAARQQISPESYYSLLKDEDQMQQQVYNFLPRQKLEEYWQTLLEQNILLLNNSLAAVK